MSVTRTSRFCRPLSAGSHLALARPGLLRLLGLAQEILELNLVGKPLRIFSTKKCSSGRVVLGGLGGLHGLGNGLVDLALARDGVLEVGDGRLHRLGERIWSVGLEIELRQVVGVRHVDLSRVHHLLVVMQGLVQGLELGHDSLVERDGGGSGVSHEGVAALGLVEEGVLLGAVLTHLEFIFQL